ncbi:MAG: HAMP domain-containing sensor histidine kinase [Gammaproteobacteria bacterium]|nr:HAMP domain-containing sensor histidine kinase [Gammaproteobacteria bacterium]
MILRRDPPKALQLGFLALLVICVAQVAWWIADQARLASGERDRLAALYRAEAHAMTTMLGNAPAPAEAERTLGDAFPHLKIENGTATIRDRATALLEDDAASRINRYAWEGGFFLLVLLAGMAILTRAIRFDADLRRRQQNFLVSVSHEFKSPLASMRLSAETLMLRAPDPDSRHLGQRLLEDGERLLRMVDNLLNTAQLEDGRLSLQPESIAVRAVVEAAVADYEELARAHGIALSQDVPRDLAIEADRVAIETVLRNLLDNAIKACVDGDGKQVGIHASASDDGRSISLHIADDGVGFPPGDASKLFGKFYRQAQNPRRATPGSGLGLYLVRRLTKLSGARASATSEGLGQGAEFTVVWPRARGT